MRTELPEVKRCCFCIPLRHGLLVMGLLKTLLTALYLALVISNLVRLTSDSNLAQKFIVNIVVASLLSACLILDVCVTLVFIVGGCMKNVRIMSIYFVFSIVMMCVVALFFLWSAGKDMVLIAFLVKPMSSGFFIFARILRFKILIGIFVFGFQTYMITLTKTEIEKLKNKAKPLRFTNATIEGTWDSNNTEGTIDPPPTLRSHNYSTDDQFINAIIHSQNSRENEITNQT